jgi:hypothetical protein
MTERFDVFISYAHRDRPEWVETLAENLHQMGFEVFLDAWEIGAGDVLVHKLDQGILEARHGVLVITKSYFERPFVQAEYAAIMHRAIKGQQRVIPIVVDDVEIPPLLAPTVRVDFRGADGPKYDQRLEELARALRGKKGTKDRPERTGETAPPPETRYRPEGAIRRTLRIAGDRVTLLGGEGEVSHEPRTDVALSSLLHDLDRARRHRFATDGINQKRGGEAGALAAEAELHQASLAVGEALTRRFLSGAAGDALRKTVRSAETGGSSLELALEVTDDDLRSLPWETLRIPGEDGPPGEPLTLHPRVRLFRTVPGDDPVPALAIPGPLRILVAIGSPESGRSASISWRAPSWTRCPWSFCWTTSRTTSPRPTRKVSAPFGTKPSRTSWPDGSTPPAGATSSSPAGTPSTCPARLTSTSSRIISAPSPSPRPASSSGASRPSKSCPPRSACVPTVPSAAIPALGVPGHAPPRRRSPLQGRGDPAGQGSEKGRDSRHGEVDPERSRR